MTYPSGTIVRRHRIPFRPVDVSLDEEEGDGFAPSQGRTFPEPHLTLWDLNVRRNVDLYGRRHRIVDCDQFTRLIRRKTMGFSFDPTLSMQ